MNHGLCPGTYAVRQSSASHWNSSRAKLRKGNFVVDLIHGPDEQTSDCRNCPHNLPVDMAVQTVACILCKSVDESPTIYDSRIRKAIRRMGVN